MNDAPYDSVEPLDMPNTPSAHKRLRQNLKRQNRNRAVKSLIRKRIRQLREAVAGGDIEQAEATYRVAAKHLDRAGARKVIHPNKAARQKSRLQSLIKSAK
jgi:small subunit ribosomal protein S20